MHGSAKCSRPLQSESWSVFGGYLEVMGIMMGAGGDFDGSKGIVMSVGRHCG